MRFFLTLTLLCTFREKGKDCRFILSHEFQVRRYNLKYLSGCVHIVLANNRHDVVGTEIEVRDFPDGKTRHNRTQIFDVLRRP